MAIPLDEAFSFYVLSITVSKNIIKPERTGTSPEHEPAAVLILLMFA